jgi:hypothetical protein
MKRLFAFGLIVLSTFSAAHSICAGPYKSSVLLPSASLSPALSVPEGRFLVIRDFTQNGGTIRGTVTVTVGNQMATVLTAAIVPADSTSSLEPINSMVIAGPATVNVMCGSDAVTCFVSYRKEAD